MFDAARDAYDRDHARDDAGLDRGRRRSATRAVLGERGYAIYDDLIHGYGTDYGPPLVDRSCVALLERRRRAAAGPDDRGGR